MNKATYNLIVTILVLIIVIGGGTLLYNSLQDRVSLSTPETTVPSSEQPDESVTAPLNPAPDFTVIDSSEGVWKLSDFLGKPVLLNFWSSNCPPCKAEMPLLQKAWETYGDQIQFMIVNLTDGYNDTFASAMKVIEENQYTFPVFFDTDSQGAIAYSIYSIPMTFFIDENGGIVGEHLGMLNEQTLESGIQSILPD
ncbi:MAG: TlpA family protein disulfide reductase [Oscillospiraceae bacterium]|nr:TlpA family protein disulfide reductase [Oscillospiraceae bacterium]MBR2890690.1 TlpA family protein disulfide reductase [Oscillospiraceae bacterium]